MLTIEVRDADKANEGIAKVEVFCDAEGLIALFKELEHLKTGSGHVHLMTPAWGGYELSEQPVGKGTKLIHHLRITMIPANFSQG